MNREMVQLGKVPYLEPYFKCRLDEFIKTTIETASLVPESTEPASEYDLDILTAMDTVAKNISSHVSSKDSSKIKPKIKITNRLSRPAGDHPGGSAGRRRRLPPPPSSPSRSPPPPPPPPPSLSSPPQRLSTVNKSGHATRMLRDGTIVRGKQGATFAGFIPPNQAPRRITHPIMYESDVMDEYDAKDGDSEDWDLEDGSVRPSPTPSDAVYFDEDGNSEDGDFEHEDPGFKYEDAGDMPGSFRLYVPADFGARHPRAIERAHNTSSVETLEPPTTEPRTNITVSTRTAVNALNGEVQRPYAVRSSIGPPLPDNAAAIDAEVSWAVEILISFLAAGFPIVPSSSSDDSDSAADVDAQIPWAVERPRSFSADSSLGSPLSDNVADIEVEPPHGLKRAHLCISPTSSLELDSPPNKKPSKWGDTGQDWIAEE
ncbi:hypothetical protein F5B21DRAFT_482788 [Xylaria acuta]|nr:hypothetical protein F5B21DRAFT_482788 [Xylaria acuta]